MTKLIFEKSVKNSSGINLTDKKINFNLLPNEYINTKDNILPEVTELEVMRHYKELSDSNFCIEKGFYPLGSCTMKYNPKVNEYLASLEDFVNMHPLQDSSDSQGALNLMYNLQEALKEITGMPNITLQPAAGAHGELCGMMIIKKYFKKIGQIRKNVIIPDSAHGTNPASAAMCGFNIIEIKSNEKGLVDIDALKTVLDDNTAAIMLTNPNTLGIYEENILEISKLVHEAGGVLYYDGANLNAIMGHTNPYKMGFDVVHINLHKTFSTPHGGGGPGSGPVGVVEKLKEFLPVPLVNKNANNKFYLDYNIKNSIGKIKSFYGNFSVLVRAYAYILMIGNSLKNVTEDAVLNANYMKEKLKRAYLLPYDTTCMHEFVLSGDLQKEKGVNTLAIAKRLMDSNFHPPTVYFPLIVHESIMIEPTESETKKRLDEFIEIMLTIAKEVELNPVDVLKHPLKTPVKRVDETLAARQPDLAYKY